MFRRSRAEGQALHHRRAPLGPSNNARRGVRRVPSPRQSKRPTGEQSVAASPVAALGMEEILRQIPGVLETRVGYTAARREPTYSEVCNATKAPAAIEVVFDRRASATRAARQPSFVFRPTTPIARARDVGASTAPPSSSRREQRTVAERVKARGEKSGRWKQDRTENARVGFWPAEDTSST